ncbi:hypothetical protein KEM55_005072 [Ascosphaera atra]|nr:hypothetical protein KEM55_005072 [Ascosphaera atra]
MSSINWTFMEKTPASAPAPATSPETQSATALSAAIQAAGEKRAPQKQQKEEAARRLLYHVLALWLVSAAAVPLLSTLVGKCRSQSSSSTW